MAIGTGRPGRASSRLGLFMAGAVAEDVAPGPAITGNPVTLDGAPVEGATIRVTDQANNDVFSTTTDASGNWVVYVEAGRLYHAVVEIVVDEVKHEIESIWNIQT